MHVFEREEGSIEILSTGADDTQRVGFVLGQHIHPPALIALVGELGSGKTVLTRGIAAGLGVRGHVRSPSFCLINEYKGSPPLYHLDCYRVGSVSEWQALGYHEYFFAADAVVVVEWADLIRVLLPPEHLEILIDVIDMDRRRILVVPKSALYQVLIRSVQGRLA